MKSFFFLSVFLLLTLFVWVLVYFNIDKVSADNTNNVSGWAWSENIGWISMNCANEYNGKFENHCDLVNYGVNINKYKVLENYAWSPNVGWLSFNETSGFPKEPKYSVRITEDNILSGWAKFINLKDKGWVNFRGRDCAVVNNCEVKQSNGSFVLDRDVADGQSSICYNCNRYKKSCIGGVNSGLACNTDSDCKGGGKCNGPLVEDKQGVLLCSLCFSRHLPDICLETNDPSCTNIQKQPVANICSLNIDSKLDKVEDFCNDCSEYWNSPPNENEKIITCGKCPKCYEYGVGLTFDNRLVGWAWQGNSDNSGVGWIQFNTKYSKFYGPWIETKFGGVYSVGNLGSKFTYKPPSTKFSATYEIQAGGDIIHFPTQSGEKFVFPNFEKLQFPSSKNVYTNALGRIDLPGIYVGQYGELVSVKLASDINPVLDGKVYYVDSDLNVNIPLVFKNGTNNQSGAGLILVEGNLYINNNIVYEDVPITKLKNLASVAWIVKGDVFINPNVEKISGAFIVLGDGLKDKCPNLNLESKGCGRFSTGKSDKPFELYGLVMARQLNLQRRYFSTERGAERFIYDGRALANTPPGLGDITQVLPNWKEVLPE